MKKVLVTFVSVAAGARPDRIGFDPSDDDSGAALVEAKPKGTAAPVEGRVPNHTLPANRFGFEEKFWPAPEKKQDADNKEPEAAGGEWAGEALGYT